jgi:hypothetical protein
VETKKEKDIKKIIKAAPNLGSWGGRVVASRKPVTDVTHISVSVSAGVPVHQLWL